MTDMTWRKVAKCWREKIWWWLQQSQRELSRRTMAGPDCWLNYDSDKTCPRKEPYAFLCKWFWTRLKPSCCLCQRLGLPATLRLPMPSAQRWVLWKILHHCLWVTAWMQRFESGKLWKRNSTCWSWFMTCMKITAASRLSMLLSTRPGSLLTLAEVHFLYWRLGGEKIN